MSKSKRYRKKHGIYTKVTSKECWDLQITLCDFIIPRLERFKKDTIGTPLKRPVDKELTYLSMEEWHEVIDTMIWSFQTIQNDEVLINSHRYLNENGQYDEKKLRERNDRIQLGLNNFALYFQDLWW